MDEDDPIWYASYGSNCLATRFTAYLVGGRADGTAYDEPGSRDPRPPSASQAFWFPNPVRFVGSSAKWGGGGVAVLDHEPASEAADGAAGRIYRITVGQFEDVVAQESRRIRTRVPWDDLVIGRVLATGSRSYDGLLALEPVEGVPVVTITSPRPVVDRRATPPSAPYLRSVLRGLLEVHELPMSELIERVRAAPGVADGWSATDMARLVTNRRP